MKIVPEDVMDDLHEAVRLTDPHLVDQFRSYFHAAADSQAPATVQNIIDELDNKRRPLLRYFGDPVYFRFHRVSPAKYQSLHEFYFRMKDDSSFLRYARRLSMRTISSLRDQELNQHYHTYLSLKTQHSPVPNQPKPSGNRARTPANKQQALVRVNHVGVPDPIVYSENYHLFSS